MTCGIVDVAISFSSFPCVRDALSLSLSLSVNLIKRESKREKSSLSLTLIHEDVAWGLRCNPAKSTDGFDKLSTMAPRAAPPLTTPLLLPRIAAPAVAARRPSSGPVARLDDMLLSRRF